MRERPRRERKDPDPLPWCVIAWIVWLPETHAALKPALTKKPKPAKPLHDSRPGHREKVRSLMNRVNEIFRDCGIQFTVCETHVIDATELKVGEKALADLFADDGSITLGGEVMPSTFLQSFATNGPKDFNDKMRTKCLHLFFVHEMKYADTAVPERGSGGSFGAGADRTSYAMVGVKGVDGLAQDALVQAIAHEFGHALGLSLPDPQDTHSTADENLMKALPNDGDVKLTADQCTTMRNTLAAHIRRGCP
jgi:hypothetical protein